MIVWVLGGILLLVPRLRGTYGESRTGKEEKRGQMMKRIGLKSQVFKRRRKCFLRFLSRTTPTLLSPTPKQLIKKKEFFWTYLKDRCDWYWIGESRRSSEPTRTCISIPHVLPDHPQWQKWDWGHTMLSYENRNFLFSEYWCEFDRLIGELTRVRGLISVIDSSKRAHL